MFLYRLVIIELGYFILTNDLQLMAKLENYVAQLIKVAIGVKIVELMRLHQDHVELLPLVYEISLQSVSVTVGKAM